MDEKLDEGRSSNGGGPCRSYLFGSALVPSIFGGLLGFRWKSCKVIPTLFDKANRCLNFSICNKM